MGGHHGSPEGIVMLQMCCIPGGPVRHLTGGPEFGGLENAVKDKRYGIVVWTCITVWACDVSVLIE